MNEQPVVIRVDVDVVAVSTKKHASIPSVSLQRCLHTYLDGSSSATELQDPISGKKGLILWCRGHGFVHFTIGCPKFKDARFHGCFSR